MANYSFLRVEMPNLDWLGSAGWDTPLFAANDPRLSQQVAAARQRGMQYGIWADPNWFADKSPEAFARQMAGLYQQYGPSVLVPDIEFIGKGNQGSAGWQYNQQLADAWRRYLPNANTAVTVMPNQSDFNYGAWKGVANRWLPQAYGANPMKDVFDPRQIIQTLVAQGVDPSLVTPVLGPGHAPGYQGDYSLWTADDFLGRDLPQAYRGGPSRAPQQTRPPWEGTLDPSKLPPQPDRLNPNAVAYAQKRLAQLRALGVAVPDATDPTAAWRQASIGIADIARQHGYTNPRDFLASAGQPVQSGPPSRPGPRPMPAGMPRGAGQIIAGMKGSLRDKQLPLRPGPRPAINIQRAAKNGQPYLRSPLGRR